MQHAHLAGNASARITPIDDNAALALVLDPSIQPEDLATRMGLSLMQLAAWSREHAPQLADLKEFFATRATLIASRLHMASLAALERVLNLAKEPDPKTQERSRKAASTILRNLAPPAARKACSPTVREGSLATSPAPSSTLVAQASQPLPTTAPISLPKLVAQASPPVLTGAPLVANADAPAARLRAHSGGAPAVHLPSLFAELAVATFSLRELLLPAIRSRIPA